MAEAEALVRTFFDDLAEGRYEQAATIYGGSYEVLREYNPDTQAKAGLLEAYCTRQRACLPVLSVVEERQYGEVAVSR